MADANTSNVRSVVIKGGAADDYYKSKGLKKTSGGKRRITRKIQHGGDEPPSPSINVNMRAAKPMLNAVQITKGGGSASSNITLPGTQPQIPVPNTPANIVAKEVGTITAPISPPNTITPPGAVPTPPKQEGGKLILAGKKSKTKLILAPPSGHKKSRKIRVQLSGMKKRLTRAKSIHKESKEKSIDEIRKILEEAKLIKPSSAGKKVPDDMLRNIYRDYMLLRGKAL